MYQGNALSWNPPFRFDDVSSMILPGIPKDLRGTFVRNLFERRTKPGGSSLVMHPTHG